MSKIVVGIDEPVRSHLSTAKVGDKIVVPDGHKNQLGIGPGTYNIVNNTEGMLNPAFISTDGSKRIVPQGGGAKSRRKQKKSKRRQSKRARRTKRRR